MESLRNNCSWQAKHNRLNQIVEHAWGRELTTPSWFEAERSISRKLVSISHKGNKRIRKSMNRDEFWNPKRKSKQFAIGKSMTKIQNEIKLGGSLQFGSEMIARVWDGVRTCSSSSSSVVDLQFQSKDFQRTCGTGCFSGDEQQ